VQIGINSYSYLWNFGLEEALEQFKQMGFRSVELMASPPHIYTPTLGEDVIRRVRQTIERLDLQLVALNPISLDINLASVNEDVRRFTVDRYKQLIALAHEWDVPFVIVPPGRLNPLAPPDPEWIWSQAKPGYEAIIEYAERKNVTLLLENVPSLFIQTAEDVMRVLNELKSDHFGSVYDVANGYMVEDPADGIRKLGSLIRHVHLSDTRKTQWLHDVIGAGEIDFASVHQALEDIHFDGVCMLEVIHREPSRAIPDSVRHLESSGWLLR
jgi:deoxyribonuclease-4